MQIARQILPYINLLLGPLQTPRPVLKPRSTTTASTTNTATITTTSYTTTTVTANITRIYSYIHCTADMLDEATEKNNQFTFFQPVSFMNEFL